MAMRIVPVEYRSIPGFPDWYRVGDDGTMWSRVIKNQGNVRPKRLGEWYTMRPAPCRSTGYSQVAITNLNGLKKSHRVYRLVMLAFVGPLPDGMQTRHLNGDRNDNRLSNLAYGTPKENNGDKYIHGTHLYGDRTPKAKLTEVQVVEIRQKAEAGMKYKELAEIYGVKWRTIGSVVRAENWKRLHTES